ncbi:hypothetical protein MUY27_12525 [Mucilaginibacter sp. RS28]|uniref:Uncharacterized protein n=1 Tax=Mucilaginibacter straminoryzae TaxID=2932774 RepID=A0A9X1X5N8_9SPHI|nr:hypothetical protein [Mucilaginibacter straminoryzae]MCJ8210535.1 hypothetical protein [Mucilaginibacter straminoryzae]
MMKIKLLLTALFLANLVLMVGMSSCKRKCKGSAMGCEERLIISFKPVENIDYTEVYRRMKNGLSFNKYGYQLEPQWKLKFVSADSARIYSPIKKQFINFPLTRGYDSIFNTARTWYKVRKMSRDSLVLEILKFQGDSIDVSGNQVFMTFYANDYIKKLHTDSATLRRPSRRDTLFVKQLVAKANTNPDSAFAARQPVVLTTKSPLVKIEQRHTEPSLMNNFDSSDDYLDPEFYITINKAYKDFNYSFTVKVDTAGKMTYGIPLIAFQEEDYKKSYLRLSEAVMNTYLKYYLQVTPGSTLGMPHTSVISLHVKGIAAKK